MSRTPYFVHSDDMEDNFETILGSLNNILV
jgi:hypothetical protein